jgi:hypothetical protein
MNHILQKAKQAISYWAIRVVLSPYKEEILEVILTIYNFITTLLL